MSHYQNDNYGLTNKIRDTNLILQRRQKKTWKEFADDVFIEKAE